MSSNVMSQAFDSAILAGVLVPIMFFIAYFWYRGKQRVHLVAMAFVVFEMARLWLYFGSPSWGPHPLMLSFPAAGQAATAISYALTLYVAPIILGYESRCVLTRLYRIGMWILTALATYLLFGYSIAWMHGFIMVGCAIIGVLLVIASALAFLKAPDGSRLAPLSLGLGFFVTSLMIWPMWDVMQGHASPSPIWLTSSIARVLFFVGAVLAYTGATYYPALLQGKTNRSSPPLPAAPDARIVVQEALQSSGNAAQIEQRLTDTLAELTSALEMQRQMNALMSHELRVPVSTISAATQSLEMILLGSGEMVDSRLARIRRSITRVTELLEQFLSPDRLAETQFRSLRQQVDLSQLASDVVANLQPDAAHALIVEAVGPVVAWCDRPLTAVVLRNLIHNAIKYSPANQPIVVRCSLQREEGTCHAMLAVVDRGPGIGAEDQARIFESQFRRASHREITGMGIGLYLARRICTHQGGALSVDSTPGRGSQFIITLPCVDEGKA
ncbi:HAMP domain-containing sensor histidine kinase [Alcaligenaceae bacterium C4P045]|nr:HAMP domain-containing sensor histidine kinase [Alcaligenaceae bacterium C4P045]